MATNINDLIRGSQQLRQEVQSIEERLQHSQTISPQSRNQFFHDLDDVRVRVLNFRETAKFVNVFAKAQIANQLEDLPERITTLYGRVTHRWIDSEVSTIKEEATALDGELHSLKGTIQKDKREELASRVNALNAKINQFRQNIRPLRNDRKIIAFARDTAKKIEIALNRKILGPTLNQLNLIALQKEMNEENLEVDEMDPDVSTLFEMAEFFESSNAPKAMSKYYDLSEQSKHRVRAHLKKLSGGDDLRSDNFTTIQALIATAHEISDSCDGETYLNREEVDKMFAEISQLKDPREDKIFSLRSKGSLTA